MGIHDTGDCACISKWKGGIYGIKLPEYLNHVRIYEEQTKQGSGVWDQLIFRKDDEIGRDGSYTGWIVLKRTKNSRSSTIVPKAFQNGGTYKLWHTVTENGDNYYSIYAEEFAGEEKQIKKAKSKELVIEYMKEYGDITAGKAADELGIMRLKRVINSIKEYKVITTQEMRRNRRGDLITIEHYSIAEEGK